MNTINNETRTNMSSTIPYSSAWCLYTNLYTSCEQIFAIAVQSVINDKDSDLKTDVCLEHNSYMTYNGLPDRGQMVRTYLRDLFSRVARQVSGHSLPNRRTDSTATPVVLFE